MTDTPMTPARERMIRIWHEELVRLTDRTAVARRESLGDLLAEVDRLRNALSEVSGQVSDIDWLHARVAMLERAPVDEAADLAEGQAQLDTLPVFTRSDWDGPIARCSFGQHMAALLPSGRIGRHRMGEGWLNACPGVGKPPRADAQPEATQ